MTRTTLILASISDIPTIYSLAEKIWNHHYVPIIGQEQVDFMLKNMYSVEALKEQMLEKKHIFYLILSSNKIIGYISVSGTEEVFIHKFYIDQDVQSLGLGTEAFRNILNLNPKAQAYRLTVNRKNYKSINFYFKNGFIIEKVEDFDIGHGYFMNDFIMVLKK